MNRWAGKYTPPSILFIEYRDAPKKLEFPWKRAGEDLSLHFSSVEDGDVLSVDGDGTRLGKLREAAHERELLNAERVGNLLARLVEVYGLRLLLRGHIQKEEGHFLAYGEQRQHPHLMGQEYVDVRQGGDKVCPHSVVHIYQARQLLGHHPEYLHIRLCLHSDGHRPVFGEDEGRRHDVAAL